MFLLLCVYVFHPFCAPSPLSARNTLHQSARLICLSNTCLASAPEIPPDLPPSPPSPPQLLAITGPAPAPCTRQLSKIEMLRAGTTAPLIKFPRLIPVDPLIALFNQAPQGDGVGGGAETGGEWQTNIQLWQWARGGKRKSKQKWMDVKMKRKKCCTGGGGVLKQADMWRTHITKQACARCCLPSGSSSPYILLKEEVKSR